MTCGISDQQLFSWIDREAPELERHLADCPDCRRRSQNLRSTISEVSATVAGNGRVPLPERIGDYAVRRLLGEGGQGWVFEARQSNPSRIVALKVVKRGSVANERDEKRLQREAETLARMKHPAIAAVYEAGRTAEGQSFFAMEFVAGEPLIDYARTHGLSLERRLQLFCKVCEALDHAHQQGVIHRDIKPSNILVEPNDRPKILDFGLAMLTGGDPSLTTTVHEAGKILGTLRYMSPEHARGSPQDIDARSDVYSLCVILYELVADRLPYELDARAPHEALRIICEETPLRPGRFNRRAAGDLETIILKGLEKEPVRRYQTVGDLLEDLQAYLAGRPIRARPPSITYKFRKLVARNKLTAALLSIIFLTAGGAGGWIGLRFSEARALTRGLDAPITTLDLALSYLDRAELARRDYRHVDAEKYCRSALHGLRTLFPEGSTVLIKTRVLLGRILSAAGKPDEAEPMLRVACATYVQSRPDDRTALADAQNALGECLLRKGAFADAERALLPAYQAMRQSRGESAAQTQEVRRSLVSLYESWGRPDRAAQFRAGQPPEPRSAANPRSPSTATKSPSLTSNS